MESEGVKRYLQGIRLKEAALQNLLSEREQAEASMSQVRGLSYDRDRVQTSGNGNPMLDILCRLETMDGRIAESVADLLDVRKEATDLINGLSRAVYCEILYKRYLQGKHWSEIADETGYDERHVQRLHGKALVDFAQKYPWIS